MLNIKVDFQILTTDDATVLIVCDTSTWAHIENKPARVEITMPSGRVVAKSLGKGKNNIYNSQNLGESPLGVEEDLPDGIYHILMKGSPDNFRKERYYIRTEKMRTAIDKLYLANTDRDTLNEINHMIASAEAAIRQGENARAMKDYKIALDLWDNAHNCTNC